MSSEHVEVLREMKGWRMPPIGGSAYNAALDAAIAALSAPQPPAEAQAVEKGRGVSGRDMYDVDDFLARANPPPSAPVGVEGLIEAAKEAESMLRTVHECASHECEDCREYAGIHAKQLRDALAQQPATSHTCRNCLGIDPDSCMFNQQPAAVDGADAQDAEIEALRALLLEACDDGDEADADLLATLERARTAEAKAERLAEALLELCNVIDGHEVHVAVEGKAAHARAALRDHDQEGKDG